MDVQRGGGADFFFFSKGGLSTCGDGKPYIFLIRGGGGLLAEPPLYTPQNLFSLIPLV